MSAPQLKQPFKSKGNLTYYICWAEGRRSLRISTGETQMAAAKTFLGQWLLMEKEQPSAGAVFTVSDLWKLYKAKHVDVKTASPATLEFSWKNLEPHFGKLQLGQIDQDCVEEYERKRVAGKIGRKAKPSTVRRELNALRGCFGWCANPKRKTISVSEIPAFDLPAAGEPRDRWLKIDEIQRLMTAAGEMRRGEKLSRGELFLWLALETAARKQAILELTWDRVDFETNVIQFDVPGRIRTKKRRAAVPVSKPLRAVLLRAYTERESDLVMKNGGAIWATVQNIAIHAGFGTPQKVAHTKKPKATGISPHVLRHTAATHMARNGISLWVIAGILGNSPAMVEKVYSHHCPDGLRGGVEMISRGLLEAAE